jgi:nitrate/nitrite transporter NarK
VRPVDWSGTEDIGEILAFPFIIETVDGCRINEVWIGIVRLVVAMEFDEDDANDEDDDDGEAMGVLIIWNVGGATAAIGPTPPAVAAFTVTFVVVNMDYRLVIYLFVYFRFVCFVRRRNKEKRRRKNQTKTNVLYFVSFLSDTPLICFV